MSEMLAIQFVVDLNIFIQKVLVIPTNEELVIARDTVAIVGSIL